MHIAYTDEMRALEKQFEPYIVCRAKGIFKPNAPESAKKAFDRFHQLFLAEYDNAEKDYCT